MKEERKLQINKKKLFKQILIVIILSFTFSGGLSYHALKKAEELMKTSSVELTVNKDGEATYTGETTDGGYTLLPGNDHRVENKYNTWYKRIQNDEVRYARNGWVYRTTYFGFPRVLIYDYSWEGTPNNTPITTAELLKEKEAKMVVVGMFLVGNVTDAVVLFALLLIASFLFRKVLLYIMPPVIASRVEKNTMGHPDNRNLEKIWEKTLKEEVANRKEMDWVVILSAVIFGVGGFLNYNGNQEVFLGVIAGHFILFALIWVWSAYDIYKQGKKLEKDILTRNKKG